MVIPLGNVIYLSCSEFKLKTSLLFLGVDFGKESRENLPSCELVNRKRTFYDFLVARMLLNSVIALMHS